MSDRERDVREDDVERLAETARRLEAALQAEAPEARSERALFVAGVGAKRRPRPWLGSLAPAMAAVVVLLVIGFASRTAQPGQALFRVREALGTVGLAPSAANEIRDELDRAEALVTRAESSALTAPTRVEAIVREVWAALERADDLVGELDSDRREPFEREIRALDERADAAEDRADETLDALEEAAEEADEAREDSSGSGSGGDDSSGSGSGGDDDGSNGDDSSGSGSGGGGDNSGSGSGGEGDSSGSGSGDD